MKQRTPTNNVLPHLKLQELIDWTKEIDAAADAVEMFGEDALERYAEKRRKK